MRRRITSEKLKMFSISANYFIPPEHLKWIRRHKAFESGFREIYGYMLFDVAGRVFSLDNLIDSYMFDFVHAIDKLDCGEVAEISNLDNPGQLTFQRNEGNVEVFANDYFSDRTPAGNLVYESAAALVPYEEFREQIMAVLNEYVTFLKKELPKDPSTEEFLRQFSSLRHN